MILDGIVQIHHMENVQKLSLVLVKPLYLHVKDGPRIYVNAIVLFDIFRKANLVSVFDVHELLLSLLVIHIDFQLGDLGQIGDPLVPDMVCHPFCQQRISVKQETPLSDTVGLVIKLLRHHLVEITELLILQNLCVQGSHAVYGIACRDSQMGHLHLSVIDDRHLADLLLVTRVFRFDLLHKSAVDLLHDLIDTGKEP